MLVHIMGATDSPTCANYALKRCARDKQNQFDPATIETVLRSFFVDDVLKSVPEVATGKHLIKELIDLTRLGGNRLKKFVSNNQELLEIIPEELVSPSSNVKLESYNQTTKSLGICWNTKEDVLTFLPSVTNATNTKRGILRVIS